MSAFNFFRFTGDYLHIFAIIYILYQLLKTKSCSGISGKSQLMLLVTFVSRYLDLLQFRYLASRSLLQFYNPFFKVFFILTSLTMVYLVYCRLRKTYDHEYDKFRTELLLMPAVVLAVYVNHQLIPQEILWTLSIYLESVAMVPQLWMVYKMGRAPRNVLVYLMALGSYRALYLVNWIYRYYEEGHYDSVAIGGGILQTLCYLFFFVWYFFNATESATTIYTLNIAQPRPEDILVGKKPVEEAATLPTTVYVIDEPEDFSCPTKANSTDSKLNLI